MWYMIAAGVACVGPLAVLARHWLNLRFLSHAYRRGGVRDLRVAGTALRDLVGAEQRSVTIRRPKSVLVRRPGGRRGFGRAR